MIYELHNTAANLDKISAFVNKNEHLLPDPISHHVDIKLYCQKLLQMGHVFIYEEGSVFLGVCMGYINDYQSFVAHLQVLIVTVAEQHKGIGKQLVSHFVSASEKAGMREVTLTCDVANQKAFAFYRRMGFIRSSISHPNPQKVYLSLTI